LSRLKDIPRRGTLRLGIESRKKRAESIRHLQNRYLAGYSFPTDLAESLQDKDTKKVVTQASEALLQMKTLRRQGISRRWTIKKKRSITD
jgi:hypothetical protein